MSTKELYKKHKKTAKCKGEALQRSMKELADMYRNIPLNADVYKRYNTLKRRLFHNYTILPQILIGAITGFGASLVITKVTICPMLACFLSIFIVFYAVFASRTIFKSHILILKEYEISLIDERIKETHIKSALV